jgi:hypothetical protein
MFSLSQCVHRNFRELPAISNYITLILIQFHQLNVNLILSTIFEALMGVNNKIMVVWDMTPCTLVGKYHNPAASTFQV